VTGILLPATSTCILGGKLCMCWRVEKSIEFDMVALSDRPFAENHEKRESKHCSRCCMPEYGCEAERAM
jgi:hypothetical protein